MWLVSGGRISLREAKAMINILIKFYIKDRVEPRQKILKKPSQVKH